MPNASGVWTLSQQFQARGQGLWPAAPGAPTIGTATAGVSLCASVTFTAPSCKGYPATITSYLVTSTPGCKTASGSSSPLTVTGLTCGTSYTFKVKAQNASGFGPCSAASNSVKAVQATCATYTTAGTYSWVAPAGVTSVAVVAVGGGGGGGNGGGSYIYGGGGGALDYVNNISVTPGNSYTVVVGAGGAGGTGLSSSSGGNSSFNGTTVLAYGGVGKSYPCSYSAGGAKNHNGGAGGQGVAGGGGAGGYAGSGGAGGYSNISCPGSSGSGGGGGGGGGRVREFLCPCGCIPGFSCGAPGGGGGVGLYGQGTSGAGGTTGIYNNYGRGGSGGCNGAAGAVQNVTSPVANDGGAGGLYGGGGGSAICGSGKVGGAGGRGAVRIVWAGGSRGTPSFPSTNVGK